jgi:hypothetical protein
MRSITSLLVVCGALLLLQGCITAPVVPPLGWIYTDIKAPLDIDYNPTNVAQKSGKSESTSILGLIATGDASTQAAAANGGVTKIDYADYAYFNVVFGVFQRYDTIVYGE